MLTIALALMYVCGCGTQRHRHRAAARLQRTGHSACSRHHAYYLSRQAGRQTDIQTHKLTVRPSLIFFPWDAMQSVEMLCKLEKNLLADINPFWEFFFKRSIAEAEPYVARIDMDLYSAVVRC